MLEIAAAAAACSQAFAGVKYLCEQGKDAHQVMSQIATWYSSASDVLYQADQKQHKVPFLKKVVFSKSVESEAIKAFAASQSVKAQQKAILEIINLHYGADGLSEFRALKAKIKREREEQVYKQLELRRNVADLALLVFLCSVLAGLIFLIASLES
jgi:hypothetical protein